MNIESSFRPVVLLGLIFAATAGCNQSPEAEKFQTTSKTIKTENTPSKPAKIDPEFVAPDGTVDLQGKRPEKVERVPDVIDDDKIEIPADAKFGTPTLAEPETKKSNPPEALTLGSPDAKPSGDKATVAAAPGTDAPQKAVGIGNLASEEELNQKIAEDWKDPQFVLVLTGQQHGYLEPCGCTGLDRQKGGIIRRDTFVTQLRERGWEVLPLDVGNQVRKSFGLQPQLQFETTIKAFQQMKYKAITFGEDDLKLDSMKLIETAATENAKKPGEMISANVVVSYRDFWPEYKVIEVGKRKIGVTGYMSDEIADKFTSSPSSRKDLVFEKAESALKLVVAKLKEQGCDFLVLLAHASQEDSEKMAAAVPGFNLVVTAGGHGEPRNVLDPIPGSSALISQVGTKGMYACLVGVFDDAANPMRYQRVALSSQFKDSPPMFEIFNEYQMKLQSIVSREGFDGLGLAAQPHPSGRQFVGSDECSGCHAKAFDVWKKSPHFRATDSIVTPPNDRGAIPRHFDPECVVCHVTGWNVKSVSPYETGYASLAATPNMLGSGCENCHGPGSEHVKVENGDLEVDDALRTKIREQMRLTMADAKEKCVECHDLDNSPDFHAGPGQFMDYWERPRPGFGPVKHAGKD